MIQVVTLDYKSKAIKMKREDSKLILGVIMTLAFFGGVIILMKFIGGFGVIGGVASFAIGVAAFYLFSEVVR